MQLRQNLHEMKTEWQLPHVNVQSKQSMASSVQDFNNQLGKFEKLVEALKQKDSYDVALGMREIYDWAYSKLPNDTKALLKANLDGPGGYKAQTDFPQSYFMTYSPYPVISALTLHMLDNLKVSTKEVEKLERAIEAMNHLPGWGFLSLPLLVQSNLWIFYNNDKALSAFYRIPKKLEDLPGKYKYLMAAYKTISTGFHLKHDISITDNPADFIVHLSNTRFIIRNLRNGIHDSDLNPAERTSLIRIQSHALVQLLQAMRRVLSRPTAVQKDGLAYIAEESLPYIAEFKNLLRENKTIVLDAIAHIQRMDNLHEISFLSSGTPWPFQEFFNFPYELDAQGKRITLDQAYLDPYTHKDFILRNRDKLPLRASRLGLDDLDRNNAAYANLLQIITAL